MTSLVLKTATVDLTFLKVSSGAGNALLTETEGALLRYLVANTGRDLAREEILFALGHRGGTLRSVDITVARLRSKLGEPKQPNHIRTVRSVGYRFVTDDHPAVPPLLRSAAVRASISVSTGQLDLDRRMFLPTQGDPVALGRIDAEILERLSSGAAVPRERLIREIWGLGQHQRSLTAALRRLRERICDDPHDPKIIVALPGSALRLELPAARWESRTNIAPERTSFIERPEVSALVGLSSCGLVTVRGPAGIGKTRLAVEVGRRWLDHQPHTEVWFCDLTCALAERGILRAVEVALGMQGSSAESADRIVRVLSRKPAGTVVILDNFDQVTHHASVLEDWLRRAPAIRFLVTSRHALGIPGEVLLDLEPLGVDAAAQLFVDRAPAGHALCARSSSVRNLVARLDGLPLGIELAAARADDFTPEELLARMADRLSWLVRPPEGSSSPHRSLRGALDWSWDLLDDDDTKVAFAECSVFARSFSLELAAEILSVRRPERALCHLVERSLLRRKGDLFSMLESIREYAREKAILLGRLDAVSVRHAEACLRRALAAAEALQGHTLLASLRDLRDLRNELLAIRTSAPVTRHRIEAAVALCALLKTDGPRELAAVVCDDALALSPPPELAWRLWLARSEITLRSEREANASRELHHAVEAARAAGGTAPAIVTARLAHALFDRGQQVEAEQMLGEALCAFRAANDRGREAAALRSLAHGLSLRGEHDAARRLLEEVEQIVRETGDPLRLYYVYRDLHLLYFEQGDLERAEEAIARGLQWARTLDLKRAELDSLRNVAQIARRRGDYLGAASLLGQAAQGYEAGGDDALARLMRRNQALVSIEAGLLSDAEQLLVEICRHPEHDALRIIDLGNLAIVWHLQGKVEATIQSIRRILEPITAQPALPAQMRCGLLAHLAAAYADNDMVDAALRALSEARGLCPKDPLVGLLSLGVELSLARAGQRPLGEVLRGAKAALRLLMTPGPGYIPSAVARDQDLNFARLIVDNALAKTKALEPREKVSA